MRWATKPVSRAQHCYYRLPRLLLELEPGQGKMALRQTAGQLAAIELLILDDWGLEAVNAEQRNACWRSWMIGRKYSTVGQSAANGKSGTRAWGQHSGRCDPDRLDAQRFHRLSLKENR